MKNTIFSFLTAAGLLFAGCHQPDELLPSVSRNGINSVTAQFVKNNSEGAAEFYGEFKGYWEFPGGKLESGETPQQALRREIQEELATTVDVGPLVGTVEYGYPDFHLSLQCYHCRVLAGHLTLLEHEAARWLPLDALASVDWLPADRDLVRQWQRQGTVAAKK